MSPLISAAELALHLDDVRLLDARPDAAAYAKGHLPGAFHASLERDLSAAQLPGHDPAHGGRHPLPPAEWFARKLSSWGIARGMPVVIYDDQAGANAAARAYWMLRALGHREVRVLDGGLATARAAGIALTTSAPSLGVEVASAGPSHWALPTVSIDDVETYAKTPGFRVLDVRSGDRYRGESERLDPVAGHIPGAVNLFYGENLTKEGTFKPKEELRAMYTRVLGDVPLERMVVHCGSGVTACHTLLALDIAEMPGASLYVGSWSEWCRSGKPQAKG